MSCLPSEWRTSLPQPYSYFRMQVELGTPGATGIARGRCPLHEDVGASLDVNLNSGNWQCSQCGSGTLPEFHQRLTRLKWTDAVLDLIRLKSDTDKPTTLAEQAQSTSPESSEANDAATPHGSAAGDVE